MQCVKLLLSIILIALPVVAPASVYTCVNARGERSISDKPCAPSQTTQKIVKPAAAPLPSSAATEAGAESRPQSQGAASATQETEDLRQRQCNNLLASRNSLQRRQRRGVGAASADSIKERRRQIDQEMLARQCQY